MKEISRIVGIYDALDLTARKVALATVVWVDGSAYRRPGARMLITDDGRWEGSISGGCLEGDALRKARDVMRTGQPMLVTYDTTGDDARNLGVGLGCEGIIDVLIEPIRPDEPENPLSLLRTLVAGRHEHVIATIVQTEAEVPFRVGQRLLETDPLPDALAETIRNVAADGRPVYQTYTLPAGKVSVFVEQVQPGLSLHIFGAGFDTIPVVKLAQELGWHVTVSEDCVAHLLPNRFPTATCLLYADRTAVLDKLTITDRTAVVLMSHNYTYDKAVLASLLPTPIRYIGMLGPRKRFEKMQAEWQQEGVMFSDANLNRVYSPIGLDIGAETPDEIAVSIIAEIKAFFANRSGLPLKNLNGPIHERLPKVGQALV